MPRQRADPEDVDQGETDQMIESIYFGMESIKQLCQDLLPLGTNEQSRENFEKLTNKYKLLIKALIVHQESSKIVDRVSGEVNINGDEATESEVVAACERIATLSKEHVDKFAETIVEKNITSHPSYKEFMQIANKYLQADDDGELTETEEMEQDDDVEKADEDEGEDVDGPIKQHVPTVDPISRKELKDPVKNKNCGHIYSKASILDLITKSANGKINCPIGGCDNKNVRKAHLLETAEITKAVKQEQAKANKRTRR